MRFHVGEMAATKCNMLDLQNRVAFEAGTHVEVVKIRPVGWRWADYEIEMPDGSIGFINDQELRKLHPPIPESVLTIFTKAGQPA